MKNLFVSALAVVLGLAGVSAAALVDYTEISAVGGHSELYSVVPSGASIVLTGVIENGYVVAGEPAPSSALGLYKVTVDNIDYNDMFKFSIVTLDSGKNIVEQGAITSIDYGQSATLSLVPTQSYAYIGVKVEVADDNNFDIFNARVSNYVPEPLTLSSLALGGLALLRKNRR